MNVRPPPAAALCVALAAAPSAAPAAPHPGPAPPRARRVAVRPGVELEVLDWGGPTGGGPTGGDRAPGREGPPLVFLAGFGNTAHVFDGFAPQFRDRHRVVAITRRGFGASTLAAAGYDNATLVADVLAVVDSLRLDRPVFVAHSFGGAELNGLAARRPGAARELVYLDGGFDFAELYANPAWAHVPIPRPPLPPGGVDSAADAVAYARLMTGPGYPAAEVRAGDAWAARLAGARAFHAESLQTWLMRGTARAELRALRVPALAVYGVPRTVEEKYPWVTNAPPALRAEAERRFAVEAPLLARQRARFRREVPGARVVEIPGGRHYVFLTHPAAVARAIRAFADGAPRANARLADTPRGDATRGDTARADLAITHARVLDVRTGRVRLATTVLVRGGVIAAVRPDGDGPPRAARTVDARGRLLTPAFVDAHFHSGMVLGDSVTPGGGYLTRLSAAPDSVRAYRARVARAFLPYGVLLVRDVGSATRDLPLLRAWMARASDFPDLLPSGAQLVSPEPGRAVPPFQVAVADSAAAAAQVRAYHAVGFRHVKLYWRLREPALRGALAEARRLGMTATAHVDNGVVTHGRALALGVRRFEHAHPIAASVLTPAERDAAAARAAALLGGAPNGALLRPGAFFQLVPEQWRLLGPRDPRLLALAGRLAATGSTLTPTLHVFAQRVGPASFAAPPSGPFEDVRAFTPAQRARAAAGYRVMAGYVARLDAAGVRLATGSDTEEPRRAVLDEVLLLHDAGIPMWRALRIATLSSAEAVGRGGEYGAVEPGRRADLVLFDGDPLARPRDLLGGKVVIKDGLVWGAGGATSGTR